MSGKILCKTVNTPDGRTYKVRRKIQSISKGYIIQACAVFYDTNPNDSKVEQGKYLHAKMTEALND